MKRRNLLCASFVAFALCFAVAAPVLAQPALPPPSAQPVPPTGWVAETPKPADVPVAPVTQPVATPAATDVVAPSDVPTPTNPMPDFVDIGKSLDYMLQNFASVWYMIVAFCFYIFISILRGKAKLFGWTVKIWKLSDWLDGAGSKVKLYLIIGLSAVGMGLFALKNVTIWQFLPVAKIVVSGMVSGVVIALAAMGVNTAKDVHTDPSHPERFDPKAPVAVAAAPTDSEVTPVDPILKK